MLCHDVVGYASVPESLSCFRDDCQSGGVIVCSCHHGAWELLPAALSPHVPARAREHGYLVYRPLHNAMLDEVLRRRRAAAARMKLIADRGSRSTLLAALRTGGLVGLLADQRPPAAHSNVPITLFGRPCEMSPGLEALHTSTGAPVWFATLTPRTTHPNHPGWQCVWDGAGPLYERERGCDQRRRWCVRHAHGV